MRPRVRHVEPGRSTAWARNACGGVGHLGRPHSCRSHSGPSVGVPASIDDLRSRVGLTLGTSPQAFHFPRSAVAFCRRSWRHWCGRSAGRNYPLVIQAAANPCNRFVCGRVFDARPDPAPPGARKLQVLDGRPGPAHQVHELQVLDGLPGPAPPGARVAGYEIWAISGVATTPIL